MLPVEARYSTVPRYSGAISSPIKCAAQHALEWECRNGLTCHTGTQVAVQHGPAFDRPMPVKKTNARVR